MDTVHAHPDTKTLTLRDGRTLAYIDLGDANGTLLIVAQGTPSSRYLRYPDDSVARERHVRVITPDRPGYGLSTAPRRTSLTDWSADVAELADALGFARFLLLGYSGGGPYALACAAQLPSRIQKLGLIASIAPLSAPGVWAGLSSAARREITLLRWMPRPLIWLQVRRMARAVARDPEKLVHDLIKASPEPDVVALQRPDIRAMSLEAFAEAMRQDGEGYLRDAQVFAPSWGFALEDVHVPVLLWQGEEDRNVAPVMGHALAAALPSCTATFLPHEGHISLFANHWGDILSAMTA